MTYHRPKIYTPTDLRFRSVRRLADLVKIVAMELNDIAECLGIAKATYKDCFAPVDATFNFESPFFSIFARQEALTDYCPYVSPELDRTRREAS